ncbi:MAG: DUF4430 domain-containing protein [Actinobacteria bacterium]|nr:DUF4430 domain-containing protein [Actinomycetota bacterium]
MRRFLVAGLALLSALGAAGCGFGAGPSVGNGAELAVTRDYGHRILDASRLAHVHQSDTVLRFLEAAHRVTTRYAGGFVQSIDGLAGDRAAQRDWFFYVNGIESGVGAADFSLSGGDRVQWDYHPWQAAMRVPAIVGAWPEPFVHGYRGRRLPTRVECERPGSSACSEVMQHLTRAGVVATEAGFASTAGPQLARVLVGRWSAIRRLQVAAPLAQGPATSGIFARFGSGGAGGRLALLGVDGGAARLAPPGTGLVAARATSDQAVTWLITGADEQGVARAASALSDADLRYAFAVAVAPSGVVRLPVTAGGR